jgi:hypothetical protein
VEKEPISYLLMRGWSILDPLGGLGADEQWTATIVLIRKNDDSSQITYFGARQELAHKFVHNRFRSMIAKAIALFEALRWRRASTGMSHYRPNAPSESDSPIQPRSVLTPYPAGKCQPTPIPVRKILDLVLVSVTFDLNHVSSESDGVYRR